MNIETIFDFIKEKRGYDYPTVYKLLTGRPLLENELIIHQDFDISYTDIKSLPDNLIFYGDLNIEGCEFKILPDDLQVSGALNIQFTLIDTIPNNLTVGSHIFMKGTPLSKKYSKEEIKQMIEEMGGYIGGSVYYN